MSLTRKSGCCRCRTTSSTRGWDLSTGLPSARWIARTSTQETPTMTPSAAPMRTTRGIFATAYIEFNGSLKQVENLYKDFYRDHPFTHISSEPLNLKSVINSNNCFLHLHKHEDVLLITSILDNLIKGASGQAIQNTNIIMGWDEKLGLELKASTF